MNRGHLCAAQREPDLRGRVTLRVRVLEVREAHSGVPDCREVDHAERTLLRGLRVRAAELPGACGRPRDLLLDLVEVRVARLGVVSFASMGHGDG